jgi:hypothetical protein
LRGRLPRRMLGRPQKSQVREEQMTCPICKHLVCKRSRRRSTKDFLLSAAGLLPWRCAGCESRFYAMAVPLSHFLYAHCARCGNFDLQRIPGEHVYGYFSKAGQVLRMPAFRCDPCRHNFFSMRPTRQLPARMVTTSAD